MGLTIGYKISTNITPEALIESLQTIRSACMDLPFEEVGEVKRIQITQDIIDTWGELQTKYSWPNNTEKNLAFRDAEMKRLGVSTWEMIEYTCGHWEPGEIISLNLWPGQGCESANFIFVKVKSDADYKCHSFCKTQFSENFVTHHLLVIKILDMFKEMGFDIEVNDEGEFWETRDLRKLAKNINEYTDLLSSLFKICQSQEKICGTSVKSPIETCKNYMKVE